MPTLALVIALIYMLQIHALVLPDPGQFVLATSKNRFRDSNALEEPRTQSNLPKKIAIIGSGITGSVAAFSLREKFRLRARPDEQLEITIFERNPIVGGRITQAFAFNDSTQPVDTCAATFSFRDLCISGVAGNIGLTTLQFDTMRPVGGYGIWNGEDFVGLVEEIDFRGPQTWSLYRKLRWYHRYGSTPWDFAMNVTLVRGMFDQVLPPTILPPGQQANPGQKNLSEQVSNARLEAYVQDFFCSEGNIEYPQNGKARHFAREVLSAGERERYFGDVQDLNALELYLGYENESPIAVQGGNLRLIQRLVALSESDVRLDTEVRKIERLDDDKLAITSAQAGSNNYFRSEAFDTVIIATSLELANLTIEPELPDVPGLAQDYEDSFVTHFTTPNLLSASFFNRTGTMPQNVLTTVGNDKDPDTVPPFFSLTLLRQFQSPTNPPRFENLYKLTSRQEIPDSEIIQYLSPGRDGSSPEITWIDRQPLPRSVPVVGNGDFFTCRQLLEDIEIAPNIFYAGGGEQVAATADFGCRMGENAANLVLGA